ncbi:DUF1617 family protein [Varibaculum sp.]|uniref:DUF1617 family protein n=1 Tax=Varibaculum sp. TaxID=1895474 RepID=UPI0025ED3024|nr:DUF1617 family protein [Varibaculum sp.]
MKIWIANKHLTGLTELLAAMSLKPDPSRARTKLLELVRQATKRFSDDEYELVTQYASLNENGKPRIDPKGTFTLACPEKAQEFFTAREQLFDSLAEVSGPTYQNHLKEVKSLIETYDGELAGQQAEAFCALSEAVEQAISKGETS